MSAPGRRPNAPPVFFVDRCLGTGIVAAALRNAGLTIEVHDKHFPQNEADTVWLPNVGQRGWVVLTEDRHIKTRFLELSAMLLANTHMFVLRPKKGMTQHDKAAAFVAAKDAMLGVVGHRSAPICATVTPAGVVKEIEDWNILVARVTGGMQSPSKPLAAPLPLCAAQGPLFTASTPTPSDGDKADQS
jgi:hypothetical protein